MSVPTFEEITKFTPEKSLTVIKKKFAGRNSYGRITVRHHGGGNKVKYRIIDFKRQSLAPATVIGIEYDPNRSAYIALLQNTEGEKSYIVAPVGLTDGDVVYTGPDADIKPGNTLPIENIPVGTFIHNIELYPGKGAQLVRSAGAAAQLMLVVGTRQEDWQSNMALAVKLTALLEKRHPGITRPISFRTQRFNQDLLPGALLVEVGAAGNSHPEAMEAARQLADAVAALGKGTQ